MRRHAFRLHPAPQETAKAASKTQQPEERTHRHTSTPTHHLNVPNTIETWLVHLGLLPFYCSIGHHLFEQIMMSGGTWANVRGNVGQLPLRRNTAIPHQGGAVVIVRHAQSTVTVVTCSCTPALRTFIPLYVDWCAGGCLRGLWLHMLLEHKVYMTPMCIQPNNESSANNNATTPNH